MNGASDADGGSTSFAFRIRIWMFAIGNTELVTAIVMLERWRGFWRRVFAAGEMALPAAVQRFTPSGFALVRKTEAEVAGQSSCGA